jgi:hypothetical protein
VTDSNPANAAHPPQAGISQVQAELERLDAALDPRDYATTLTTGPGRTYLSVTSRHAQIGDDVWADNRAFYWSWGEWIAPVSDPATAARMISTVLRAVPQPAHD